MYIFRIRKKIEVIFKYEKMNIIEKSFCIIKFSFLLCCVKGI